MKMKTKDMKCRSGGLGYKQRLVSEDFYFQCKMSFCIGIVERQGDPLRAPTQTETAYFCVGEIQVRAARDLLWARQLELSAGSSI